MNKKEVDVLKSAEENIKAMKNRIAFLLEQLEQASQLSVSWQEQKAILKAEINTLYSTNVDLRNRLLQMQGDFLGKTLGSTLTLNSDNKEGNELLADVLTGKKKMSVLGETYDKNNLLVNPLPLSVEANVARALFDTICAFGSDPLNKDKKLKKIKDKSKKAKGNYKTYLCEEGVFDIRYEDNGIVIGNGLNRTVQEGEIPNILTSYQANALELLSTLQIPMFLRFAQSKAAGKRANIFVDKIASMLNYIRNFQQEVVDKLGDSHMENVKLQTKAGINQDKLIGLKEKLSK